MKGMASGSLLHYLAASPLLAAPRWLRFRSPESERHTRSQLMRTRHPASCPLPFTPSGRCRRRITVNTTNRRTRCAFPHCTYSGTMTKYLSQTSYIPHSEEDSCNQYVPHFTFRSCCLDCYSDAGDRHKSNIARPRSARLRPTQRLHLIQIQSMTRHLGRVNQGPKSCRDIAFYGNLRPSTSKT